MGCVPSSAKEESARRWRRRHREEGWFEEIVDGWAPSYRGRLDSEAADLEDRRRSFEADPARHYCEAFATDRGDGRFSLSYSQYMKSQDL